MVTSRRWTTHRGRGKWALASKMPEGQLSRLMWWGLGWVEELEGLVGACIGSWGAVGGGVRFDVLVYDWGEGRKFFK
jgi:hypothetical protein